MNQASSVKKRIISFLLPLLLLSGLVASAATPTFINYQGYISNASGTPQAGSANITIRIYDAQTGGTLLFEENEGTITIANGYFSIPIGAVGDVNGTTAATTTIALTIANSLSLRGRVVVDFISVKMSAVVGYFDTLFAKKIYTESLCIKKLDGTDVCLTGDQVESVLNATQIPLLSPSSNQAEIPSEIQEGETSTSTEILPPGENETVTEDTTSTTTPPSISEELEESVEPESPPIPTNPPVTEENNQSPQP